jgi:hypothetical protein
VVTEAAKDPAIRAVTNSPACLAHGVEDGLDRYKRCMGYQVLPFRSVVEFHPLIRPLLTNAATVHAARLAARLRPRNPRLELLSKLLAG